MQYCPSLHPSINIYFSPLAIFFIVLVITHNHFTCLFSPFWCDSLVRMQSLGKNTLSLLFIRASLFNNGYIIEC